MTVRVRLLFRIVRGAGWRDAVRLALMAVGVAVSVLALMFAILLPQVFGAQRAREADRVPVIAVEGVPSSSELFASSSIELYRGAPFTKILLGGSADGIEPPPGVASLPGPGQVVVSPALRRALAADAELAARVPGIVTGEIGSSGLADPDELFAYVGVEGEPGPRIAGFGQPGVTRDLGDSGTLAFELAVLIGGPALAYLIVVSRLSIGTRMRRLRALRLIGLSAREAARIFAGELAFTAGLGSAVALLAYPALQDVLGGSEALGVRWFSDDGALHPVLASFVWVVAVLIAYAVGDLTARRMLRFASQSPPPPRRRATWWTLSGLCVVAASALTWLVIALPATGRGLSNSVLLTIYLSGLVLIVAGIAGGARATRGVATLLGNAPASLAPAFRLGLRSVRGLANDVVLTVMVVGCFVLATGLSASFVQALRVNALGEDSTVSIQLPLTALGPVDRTAAVDVAAQPDTAGYIAVDAASEHDNPFGSRLAQIYVGRCQTIAAVLQAPAADCTSERGRLVFATQLQGDGIDPALTAGQPLTVVLQNGDEVTIHAPDAEIRSDRLLGFYAMVLPPEDAPWASRAESATIQFRSDLPSYDSLLAAIDKSVPTATVLTEYKDGDAVQRTTRQEGVLAFATLLGLILSLAALAVAGVNQRLEQRRSTATLRMLGVASHTLRSVSIVQKALPVLLTCLYFAATAILTGQAFLEATNSVTGLHTATITRTMLAAGVAVLASITVGALATIGSGHRREEAME